MRTNDRKIRPLTRQEALHRLGSAAVGRVVFTRRWLPAIRFVSHVLDNGKVIICGNGAEITAPGAVEDAVGVAYETDQIDPATRTGWSVTVIGPATLVTDPRKAARYRGTLGPWPAGETNDIISIDPQSVTGYEITAADPAGTSLPAPATPAASAHPAAHRARPRRLRHLSLP